MLSMAMVMGLAAAPAYGMEGQSGSTGGSVSNVQTTAGSFPGLDFESGVIPSFVKGGDATLSIVDSTNGSKGLKVDYKAADFPTVKFTAETPWSFGGGALAFEVTNPTNEPVVFFLRVDDDKTADGVKHSTVSTGTSVKANSTSKFYMSFGSNALDLGMRFLPPNPAGNQLGYGWGEKSLNASNIVEFQIWQMYAKKPSTLIFDNIKVIPDPSSDLSYLDGLVDKYGQYTGIDWGGKVKSDQDLVNYKLQEAQQLASSQPPLATSKYGGWLNGPKLEGTGHFRVTKHEGKWTLVDPEGYLFFSTGLDIARLPDMMTWISGRENMFEDVPAKDGPLGDHYDYTTFVARAPLGQTEGWLFNHYAANLERKYGDDYKNEWRASSVARFKNWGFNSLGNWSDPELYFGKGNETKLAYVANGWTHVGTHAKIGPFPDVFDPEYKNSVEKMVQDQILAYGVANDEWMLGVYIDNEMEWGNPRAVQSKYSLISHILETDATLSTSYAKKAMLAHLKATYQDSIASLNAKWGTSFASFAAMEAPYQVGTITDAMVPDFSAMLKLVAEQYFSTVDTALTAALPNTLYLGSRFAEWGTSLEVQEVAAKYVDVISFNIYKEDVDGENWMHLEALDMPTIIGEYAFASNDRGMFGTGPVADTASANQQDRADKYLHYMKTVLKSPYFVGAHWFQYVDQPLLGRAWDGENYNLGFVDVTDVPYPAMVAAAKELHAKAYDVKFLGLDDNEGPGETGTPLTISFEASEDLSIVSGYKGAVVEYQAQGATDGERAMKVNVGTLDTDYAGVTISPSAPWNLGKTPSITADVTNPTAKPNQVRVNVTDASGALRTFYFVVDANQSRAIVLDKFKASPADWGATEGFWGAESGLDFGNITSLSFYLWEDAPESGDSFIIDKLTLSHLVANPNPNPNPTKPSIAAANQSVASGATFSVPVTVRDVKDLGRLKATIQYDHSLLTLKQVTFTDAFSLVERNTSTPGTIVFDGVKESGITGTSTTVATLEFTAKAGITESTPASISFANLEGNLISEAPYAFTAQPTTITIEKLVVAGDVNDDGKVDGLDALKLMKHLANMELLNEKQTQTADYDGDGQLTTSDALRMLKKSVGLIQ